MPLPSSVPQITCRHFFSVIADIEQGCFEKERRMASTWIAYNELAWTEDLLATPASYEDEVKVYVDCGLPRN